MIDASGTGRRDAWRRWLAGVLPLDASGISLASGIRAAVAVALPVVVGEEFGLRDLSWIAIVAFWGCLADPGGAWRERLAVLAGFTVVAALGTVLAALAAPSIVLATLLTLLWCFAASLARVFGAAATSAGLLLITDVLVSLGLPATGLHDIALRAGLTLAGGAWAMLLVLILWRLHPHGPARHAVGRCWQALGAYVGALARLHDRRSLVQAPWGEVMRTHRRALREAIERARAVVVTTRRQSSGRSGRGQALLGLLAEVERSFERLVALSELLEVAGDWLSDDTIRAVHVALRRIGREAGQIGATLDEAESKPVARRVAGAGERLALRLTARGQDSIPLVPSILQLVAEIAEVARCRPRCRIGRAVADPARRGDRRPPAQARCRNNSGDAAQQSPPRLAAFPACAPAGADRGGGRGGRGLARLPRGYWLTITAAVTLQPFLATTWRRALERVAGSVLGGMVAALIGVFATTPTTLAILVVPLTVATMTVRSVNYTLFVFCLTPQFILIAELFQAGGLGSWDLAGLRALDSLAGGCLGLTAAFLLWPSREEPILRRRLADAVASVGRLVERSISRGATIDEVQTARRNAGLACNNAEASIERLAGEPRSSAGHLLEPAMTIITACRRLGGGAAAIMAVRRAEGGTTSAETRQFLDEGLAEIARAIEAGRCASLPPAPAEAGHDAIGRELAELRRQVETLRDAAERMVAADAAPAEVAR